MAFTEKNEGVFTEKTRVGYGSRIKSALSGLVLGPLIFIAATSLLFWNEGRSVRKYEAIVDASNVVVPVDDISTGIFENDGKLIHATAFADTDDVLTDSLFGISLSALNLERKVSYYQYKENKHTKHKNNLGGSVDVTTTYTYKLDWVDKPIASEDFRDPKYRNKNTVLFDIDSEIFYAKNVSFGAYSLPSFLIRGISNFEEHDLELSKDVQNNLNIYAKEAYKRKKGEYPPVLKKKKVLDEGVNIDIDERDNEEPSLIHVLGNTVYIGLNPNVAEVGDVKIEFNKTLPTDISVIAKAKGDTFTKYITKNKQTFYRVEVGNVTPEEMFQNAEFENSLLTWMLRFVGVFFLWIGAFMFCSIIPMLLMVFPPLGSIVGAGIAFTCFLLTLIWGIFVIAVAWFFYRPLLSIVLFAVMGVLIFLLKKKLSKKTKTDTFFEKKEPKTLLDV